jgi:hypothetical protein
MLGSIRTRNISPAMASDKGRNALIASIDFPSVGGADALANAFALVTRANTSTAAGKAIPSKIADGFTLMKPMITSPIPTAHTVGKRKTRT